MVSFGISRSQVKKAVKGVRLSYTFIRAKTSDVFFR